MQRKEIHTKAPSEYEPSRRVIAIVVVLLVFAIGVFFYYCYQFVERQAVVQQQSPPATPISTPASEPEASPSVAASGRRTPAPPTISATPEPQEELPSEPISIPASAQYRCDGRTRCSQMTSCDEAKFFLRSCPGTQMDGDSDGIPCEQQWCGN